MKVDSVTPQTYYEVTFEDYPDDLWRRISSTQWLRLDVAAAGVEWIEEPRCVAKVLEAGFQFTSSASR